MSEKNGFPENVIIGPWKKRKENLPDKKIIAEQMAIAAADKLTMSVMQQMIQMMNENDIDIDETSFIRDAAMIFELVQGTIYRDYIFSHPTHKFVEEFVHVTLLSDDNVVETEVDFDSINALVELLEDVDGPEIP